ncbi:MAG: leucine-rich repeat protein [Treponema sp.]|nr:leucine-rich repeat protein [Treponema sp.]
MCRTGLKRIRRYAQKAATVAALCAVILTAGCNVTIQSDTDSDALHSLTKLKAALESAEGGASPDDPVDIAFDGKETASAVYAVLAEAGKYVNLDLSESSVTDFVSSPYLTGSAMIISLILPNDLAQIGDEAFAGWRQLQSISIPNSVTAIGDYAFYYCTSLKNVTIPDFVTTIGEYAFHNCTLIDNITIPASVEYIDRDAFSSCANLGSVTLKGDGTRVADNTVFPGGAKFREAAMRSGNPGVGSYMAARGVYQRSGTEWIRT